LENKTRALLKKTLVGKMVLGVGEGKNNFEYRKRFCWQEEFQKKKQGKCFKGSAEGRVCFTV